MSIIVTDTGFSADPQADHALLDLGSDTDPVAVDFSKAELIRVDFPNFADGRGFTIARQLRLRGYRGHLRAKGHVLADQYAMARRAGFDDVEISEDLAARQPQADWLARANWSEGDYQSRLRG